MLFHFKTKIAKFVIYLIKLLAAIADVVVKRNEILLIVFFVFNVISDAFHIYLWIIIDLLKTSEDGGKFFNALIMNITDRLALAF